MPKESFIAYPRITYVDIDFATQRQDSITHVTGNAPHPSAFPPTFFAIESSVAISFRSSRPPKKDAIPLGIPLPVGDFHAPIDR